MAEALNKAEIDNMSRELSSDRPQTCEILSRLLATITDCDCRIEELEQ